MHDELIVEAREDDAQRAAKILSEEMEHAAQLRVKLVADVHIGKIGMRPSNSVKGKGQKGEW